MLNKVLIADDDPEIRRILRCYLESSGYDVSVVDNGRGALELVREEQPSYVITDWDMPELSGLELCRQIRQMELFHYVYVVFLTGRSNEEDLVAAMDVGADDFLNKPLRKHELMARLKAGTRVLHLESRLSRLAANDALSGLLMRRAFVESAEKEWQRARRYRLPLSAVMLDIDFFKQVNDTHGHLAGDEVIRRVADLIRQNARSSDILCRYGGEEFCVLLTETEEVAATTWAERLRRIIADTTITYGETNMQVTVSLGVTGMLAEMEEKDELLELADQCLLSAKQRGRNCVVSVQSLIDSGSIPGDTDNENSILNGVVASDAMIPLSHCLRGEWSVIRAASYFLQYRVSSAPVADGEGNLLGIVSDKDVLAIAHDPLVRDRCVNEVMRSNVISYEADTPLSRILSFLTRAAMRSVVITSAGKPCGQISRAVVVRWFLQNHWKEYEKDPRSIDDTQNRVAGDDIVLLTLATSLAEEADRLQHYLQSDCPEVDAAHIVGGASRMQQLIEDLLAGSASGNRTGGGLPF